jgi:predicted aspartyl protease
MIEVELAVRSGSRGTAERVRAIVDPDATYSMFPASLLSRLQVEVWEHNRRFDIYGAEVYYDFGTAHLAFDGRELPCSVIFGPEGRSVLGATALQTFGLKVDLLGQRLVKR